MTKRITFITLLSAGIISAAPVWAQDVEPVDEIIARGSIQTDPAMSAWNAGDYETAEIEFKRNAFCALRAERNFISSLQAAQRSSTNADLSAGNLSTPVISGGAGGAVTAATTPDTTSRTNLDTAKFKTKDSETTRTCENRAFQLYMMGVSQLKLGKRADAKKTLIRAAKMRNSLYDAHFRISLLEYQDGNITKAQKHLKKLRKLESRYKKGDANKEIKAQIAYLRDLLG